MDRAELIARLTLLGEIESTQTAYFHQAAAARLGLGITDLKALSIILRDGPQTAGELMAHLHVTSGAVTGIVDRLRAKGLVTRAEDPADRRRVIISVDTEGLSRQENVYVGIGESFEKLYSGYTDAQLEFLAAHYESAIELTKRATSAL